MNLFENRYLVAKMRKELERKFDPLQIKKRLDDYREINSRQKGPIEEFYEHLCSSLSDIKNIPDPRITNLIDKLKDTKDENTKLLRAFLNNLVIKSLINLMLTSKYHSHIFSWLDIQGKCILYYILIELRSNILLIHHHVVF